MTPEPGSPKKKKAPSSTGSLRGLRLKRQPNGTQGSSLVRQAVEALRRRILATSGGNTFLGSEEQLMTALGISRPTFRQAARLLEHERLLKIKRGIGGGFFAQLPTADAVTHLAAIYLNSQGVTLLQLSDASAPMLTEAARLLAKNSDRNVRLRLTEYLQEHAGVLEHPNPGSRDFMRVLLGFENLLGKLSGNPAVGLMISVMRDLVRDSRYGSFSVGEAKIEAYTVFMRRLAQVISDGDNDMAMLIVRRHSKQVRAWLPNDGGSESV